MKTILVTGGAGFIGSNLVDKLLSLNNKVTIVDNFDDFYDVEIKRNNISEHLKNQNYNLLELDICDFTALKDNLKENYDAIVHLAAKAGVRPSIQNPQLYQKVNVQGTQNLLEIAKELRIKKFIFGSSSSVYGVNPNVPWSEDDYVLKPISPYAATKVAGELLGHVYHKLYNIQFLSLRFFTVYGPRQRPDLAIHKFFKLISEDKEIPVFGDGTTRRDYTFIDDVVDGILSAINYDKSGYEIVNIGNNQTISLKDLISEIEDVIGKKAKINRLPLQAGDVPQTFANIDKGKKLFGYNPKTNITKGLRQFYQWFKENYGL